MKILCIYSPGGSVFVRKGWGRVFKQCGHEFVFWDPSTKPAFDAFSEFEPDLAILTTYDLDRATEKCIRARPSMRVIMFASAWGELPDKMDCEEYPIVRVQDEEKKRLEKLKADTGRPDYVFIHVTQKYLDPTMGGWKSIGIEPYGILNACDTFLYTGAETRPELSCDVGFVGGYWGYKSRNLNSFLLPLCQPDSGLNVKIFGNRAWPTPRYLGQCSDRDNRDLFVSATVCPNVSESHSTDYGFDCVERPFKVMGAGGFCISDHVDEFRELFDEQTLILEKDPKKYHELVAHYANNPDERIPYIKKGQAAVLANHTYFDRVFMMLQHLGLEDKAEKVMEVKGTTLGKKS